MNKETEKWQTVGHPGFQGKSRDSQAGEWNEVYGSDNWRIVWRLRDGQVWNFGEIFERGYVEGYAQYFREHPEEAVYITKNFAYGYDKDLVDKKDAFDTYALYEKPGRPNQFHHAAFNIALERRLQMPFEGEEPLQVRQGKPDVPQNLWPKGWRWSPGLIPAVEPELIPENEISGWWQDGTIEALYQRAKVLQIRSCLGNEDNEDEK